MELKLNISEKTGKTKQKILSEDNSKNLLGKKIGDKFKGELADFSGYEFEITGGSDNSGFPMRKDIEGQSRKRILLHEGIGFHNQRKGGMRVRKTIGGNTISRLTSQVNVKILKKGKEDLFTENETSKEEPSETKEVPKEKTVTEPSETKEILTEETANNSSEEKSSEEKKREILKKEEASEEKQQLEKDEESEKENTSEEKKGAEGENSS